MSGLAVVFGGSGFVGRYITRDLAQKGWRVRVASREPHLAGFTRSYGVVGQVDPVMCNIRDDASVERAVSGADVVVNCVGLLSETGANRFDAVHADGAGRIARAASELGVQRMVHISAIGASKDSESAYQRSKADGEAQILHTFPEAVILRPSVIFGTEDQFFNRFAAMARSSMIIPLVGADTRFQPVFVGDVAEAAVKAATGEAAPGVYELGGPRTDSFRALMKTMLDVIQRRRGLVAMPFTAAHIMGKSFDMLQRFSGGLFKNTVLTNDQVINLKQHNVVSDGARGFEALGVEPQSLESVLPEYLWVYRPSGQYAAITASAKDLNN